MDIDIVPAAVAGRAAVEAVLRDEATSRDCWCQFHVLSNAQWRDTTRESRRELLVEQVESLDPPRGLVALREGEPVGWCGVEPRVRLRHVTSSRLVVKESPFALDDPGVWSVYCMLVPRAARRQGVADGMLAAAIDHAEAHGATGIEGYPIDASKRGGRLPAGFSTGTLSMFERHGFAPVASLPSARTLVARTIA
ncbi:GNAT family N-acetyltransferase [Salinibacterium soli]|uniref:GNAT family N-acetyltransferase n=1 Tax=Antiquaquibacter soli TaxID=3064523 RepID=A0ABT9BJV1_9MICO|nr:GNAT family N-acetyltransferase [Protaetiibacter sp. WY-16]MDO7881294.1 GNAT family N-acetyltransferase [Protaetiibacter sp. WY-16]